MSLNAMDAADYDKPSTHQRLYSSEQTDDRVGVSKQPSIKEEAQSEFNRYVNASYRL